MTSNQCLVGDIGGTNARFAVADPAGARAELRQPLSLVCAEFASPEEAIDRYFETTGLLRPSSAVIAIAGPVRGGRRQPRTEPGDCRKNVCAPPASKPRG
ncbi:glucokinase [Phenylobacterium sp. J367]|nr:glucokinase [Phenylobacterium sp. J367]MCR5880005.1 glucokinase [Phenylobacterium sp. J367]